MSDELDDFMGQLNNAGAEKKDVKKKPAEDESKQELPPGVTPEMMEQIKQMQAAPLKVDPLKGKVDLKWFGHAGFKIQFKDKDDVQRAIYIDIWSDNKDCPQADKDECPNDADMILVSQGQFDHSFHAPHLVMNSKKADKRIVCSTEVGLFFEMFRKIGPPFMAKMQRGGTKDFDYCKITMVGADYPSTCQGPQGVNITGGLACGYVITIPNHDLKIYYAGNTNIFSDMKLIGDLYNPSIAILPIGDHLGMGPREAAYCAKNFLPNVHTFIPHSFGTFPILTGTPEAFEEQCKELGLDESKQIIHPKTYFGGSPLIEA